MIPKTDCADLQAAIKEHMQDGGSTLGVVNVSFSFEVRCLLKVCCTQFVDYFFQKLVCKLFENKVVISNTTI